MIKSVSFIQRNKSDRVNLKTLKLCGYKGLDRYVHPAVCLWHIEQKDSECRRIKCNNFVKERS
jgi:hypothetical protein